MSEVSLYMAGVLILIKVSLGNKRVGIMQDRVRWSRGGGAAPYERGTPEQ